MEIQNSKRTLFVGGLSNRVTERLLYGAFIPFGEIVQVEVPLSSGREPKGFGFVEFELVEDARAALENMDDAELCGQVIHVKIAKAKAPTDRPVWESEVFYETTQENAGTTASV